MERAYELHSDAAAINPRGLSRVEAAHYIGVSPSLFDAMVKDGRMPQPSASIVEPYGTEDVSTMRLKPYQMVPIAIRGIRTSSD